MSAKDSPHSPTPREWVHQQIDSVFDLAEGEQLWGEFKPEMIFQKGRLVKFDEGRNLGKKFEAATT